MVFSGAFFVVLLVTVLLCQFGVAYGVITLLFVVLPGIAPWIRTRMRWAEYTSNRQSKLAFETNVHEVTTKFLERRNDLRQAVQMKQMTPVEVRHGKPNVRVRLPISRMIGRYTATKFSHRCRVCQRTRRLWSTSGVCMRCSGTPEPDAAA